MKNVSLRSVCATLMLVAAQQAFPAAAPAAPAPIEAKEIAPGLYLVLGGGGANSVMQTGTEGTLVVDAKLDPESAQAELLAVDKLSKGPLRYLINTHVHPDHTGGNEVYGKRGVVIVSRTETRAVLAAGQRGGPPAPAAALPTLTFDGEPLTLHLNGETIVITPIPASHTTDSSIVRFVNANVFQLGDLFSTYRYPVLAGGTWQGFIDGVDQVLKQVNDKSRFIPGNGDIEGLAALKAWREMLVTIKTNIAALIAKGASLDEVVAAKPTAAYDKTFGSPERVIPAIYQELKGSK